MENKLLLNIIEDRFARFESAYTIVTTDFLDLAQQSHVNRFVASHEKQGAFFYGGYGDAERRKVVFLPDYLGVVTEEQMIEYFAENHDECPVVILDVTIGQKGATLKHSDYLGSLLALGIRREKTGDIIVRANGAQILVTREIAEYLADNYTKAGRIPLTVKVLPISELVMAENRMKAIKAVISSPRLDNAVAAVFDVSRKAAVEAINKGLVFVNNVETKKPDYFLKDDEKIVLRGKGKAIYRGINGTSRKGQVYANFDKYI